MLAAALGAVTLGAETAGGGEPGALAGGAGAMGGFGAGAAAELPETAGAISTRGTSWKRARPRNDTATQVLTSAVKKSTPAAILRGEAGAAFDADGEPRRSSCLHDQVTAAFSPFF